MTEFFDIVDENNEPTGKTATRAEAHSSGLWHKTVHIYFFRRRNGELEFLAHLRAATKDLNPNRWDPRFGGHVKSGKTLYETAIEEIEDEVGLKLKTNDLIDGPVFKREYFPNNEYSKTYFYEFNGKNDELHFKDGEVQKIKWVSEKEILKEFEINPEEWSSNPVEFKDVLSFVKQ